MFSHDECHLKALVMKVLYTLHISGPGVSTDSARESVGCRRRWLTVQHDQAPQLIAFVGNACPELGTDLGRPNPCAETGPVNARFPTEAIRVEYLRPSQSPIWSSMKSRVESGT
jgi:hypothetical protein